MGRDYNGKEKRLQPGRRCCDLDKIMNDKSINNWLRIIGLVFVLIGGMVATITYFVQADSLLAEKRVSLQITMLEKIQDILDKMSDERVRVNKNEGNLEYHDKRLTKVENKVEVFEVKLDDFNWKFNSHEKDDLSFRSK